MDKSKDLKCLLCQSFEQNDIKYGKFYVKNGVGVHYYCLLLSSNLQQRGNDDEGILGFLIKDIVKEADRVKKQPCIYCNKNGANVHCCQKKCRYTFHFICGLENGAQNQFYNTYRSFCDKHIFKSLRKRENNKTCSICYEDCKFIGPNKYTMNLCSPCCKNGWFHKWCLQEFASNAGYFFKCPLCNDKNKFIEKLKHVGIFIPEKDADWELEPNAYEDLLERPKQCCAPKCYSDLGRKHHDEFKFRLIYCSTCGSKAIHKTCKTENAKTLRYYKDEAFKCSDCFDVIKKQKHSTKLTKRDSGITEVSGEYSNEDRLIDVEQINNESEQDSFDSIYNSNEEVQIDIISLNSNKEKTKNDFEEPQTEKTSHKRKSSASNESLKKLKTNKNPNVINKSKQNLESNCTANIQNVPSTSNSGKSTNNTPKKKHNLSINKEVIDTTTTSESENEVKSNSNLEKFKDTTSRHEVYNNLKKKYENYFIDYETESDSSISNQIFYIHNKKILRENSKKKQTPINQKIKSKLKMIQMRRRT